MAGIKDYTSITYYNNVNRSLKFRKPLLFKKGAKIKSNHIPVSDDTEKYIKETIGSKLIKLSVLLLLVYVISTIAYINCTYFVHVL